jgi:photoactive yellow protein
MATGPSAREGRRTTLWACHFAWMVWTMDPKTYQDSQRIEDLAADDFNALPFGAIKLDIDGVVLQYNAYEARLAGRDPGKVIGRNFFTEVAPCTNVQEFAGRFRSGVEAGSLNVTFPYRFMFPDRYVDVEITMMLAPGATGAWVFVKETGVTTT